MIRIESDDGGEWDVLHEHSPIIVDGKARRQMIADKCRLGHVPFAEAISDYAQLCRLICVAQRTNSMSALREALARAEPVPGHSISGTTSDIADADDVGMLRTVRAAPWDEIDLYAAVQFMRAVTEEETERYLWCQTLYAFTDVLWEDGVPVAVSLPDGVAATLDDDYDIDDVSGEMHVARGCKANRITPAIWALPAPSDTEVCVEDAKGDVYEVRFRDRLIGYFSEGPGVDVARMYCQDESILHGSTYDYPKVVGGRFAETEITQ